MGDNDQSLSLPQVSDKQVLNKVRELTPANRVFLQLLSEGKKTLEAYKLSGYKGSDHAAYQLRSELKEELIKVLENQGVDRAGLMSEVQRLLSLPLRESEITIKSKLDLLKLLAKIIPAPAAEAKPNITSFVVNNTFTQSKQPSVDTTIDEAL